MAIRIPILTEFNKKGIRDAENTLGQFGKNVGIAFAAVGAATVAAGLVVADFASKSISAAENVRQADDRLRQVAESMGIFGAQTDAVSERLIGFAESNEIVLATDAELIKSAQAKLLTFKQVAESADETGGAFDRATMAALDLAAAGFGSAESNATQLGKALQDPIKGLTALTKSGVTFTAQEKENIKTLVQSGKTLQAQELILKAIETQVGGTAAATAKSSDKMRLAFENVQETVGEALLPVFDEFTKAITDLTPEIGEALVPIAQYMAEVFRTKVLPAIQNFTKWLASPEGTKTVNDLTKSITDSVGAFFNFVGWAIKNKEAVMAMTTAIGSAIVVYKTLKTAMEVAKAAQLLFNSAAWANPYVAIAGAIAIGLGLIVVGFNNITEAEKKTEIATNNSAGELNRFNNIKLTGITNQLNGVTNAATGANYAMSQLGPALGPGLDETGRSVLEPPSKKDFPLNPKPGQVYSWYIWENKNGQTLAVWYEQTWDGKKWSAAKKVTFTGGGGGGGGQPDNSAATARKNIQDLINNTTRSVVKAQSDYRTAVNKAQLDFLTNENKIRIEYTDKLLDIVNDSKNRIRDAFRGVASFTVQSFLSEFKQVEAARLTAFEDAKKAAKDAGSIFTEAFVNRDPVNAYLESLRAKVAENANILRVSGKLVEAGFSQTFIEQIIATGQEGGLSLAEGLLSANPEIVSEIKKLYKDIENVSDTGADALANKLYEKQGLATSQLVQLYESTQLELLDALEANYADYTKSLDDAATALREAITEITNDFDNAIADMGDKLGGLSKTIREFRNSLTGAADSAIEATTRNAIGASGKTSGAFIAEPFDIDFALGQAPGTFAANGNRLASQTVINVNVQTDASQSVAMVGKAIGNTITKYVRTGGALLVE
jgi:hypothetical protein